MDGVDLTDAVNAGIQRREWSDLNELIHRARGFIGETPANWIPRVHLRARG